MVFLICAKSSWEAALYMDLISVIYFSYFDSLLFLFDLWSLSMVLCLLLPYLEYLGSLPSLSRDDAFVSSMIDWLKPLFRAALSRE